MPAYTNYNVLLESQTDPEPGIVDDFSQGGIQHSRIFHSSTYHVFDVVYHMTKAEFDAICAAYDAAPRDFFTGFLHHDVSPAEVYTVKFLARPRITKNTGDNEFYVAVRLRGTLD